MVNHKINSMAILLQWFLGALAVMITAYLLPGVRVENFFVALVVAVVLGIINTVLRPILLILTLPVTILTLGLFALVINALLILLVSLIVPGFSVASFWWALLFSIVLTVVNFFLRALVGDSGMDKKI